MMNDLILYDGFAECLDCSDYRYDRIRYAGLLTFILAS